MFSGLPVSFKSLIAGAGFPARIDLPAIRKEDLHVSTCTCVPAVSIQVLAGDYGHRDNSTRRRHWMISRGFHALDDACVI